MTPLPPRLAAVAGLVPPGSRVADVGCDHGRLAAELARRGSFVVATDRKLRRVPEGVPFRLGDGLAPLSSRDRIEVVVLAGLGARSIVRILGASRLPVARLVLQPQTEAPLLRRWLVEHGRRIVDEALVRDGGRTYVVVAAEEGDAADGLRLEGLERDDVLAAGPVLLRRRAPGLARYWRERRDRLASIGGAEARRAERILTWLGG